MKKQYKISLIVLGLILLFAILVAVMPNLFETEIKMSNPITHLGQKAYEINGSNKVGNPLLTSKQHSRNFSYECSAGDLNKVHIPNGLYCIEHGTAFTYDKETVAQVMALDGTVYTTAQTSTTNTCAPYPRVIDKQKYSNVYYECNNNHSALENYGAYIITQPSNIKAVESGNYYFYGQSSNFTKGEDISDEIRQVAIWMTPLNTNNGGIDPTNDTKGNTSFTYMQTAINLKKEADSYQQYEDTLNKNIENPIKETGDKKAEINVNSKEQYLIIGPYKMDYVDGIADSVAFSGISNMTVKGYNDKNKTQFIKNVEILSYIQNAQENSLVFFNPTQSEGYVDRLKGLEETEKVQRKVIKTLSYPKSGQEFYLKIKNPNNSVIKANEKVNYIDIEVEYQYMTATGTKCELSAKQAKATVQPPELESDSHVSIFPIGYICTRDWSYKWKSEIIAVDQQDMIDAWGERNLYKLTINLTGGSDGRLDITMNLGGYVWEDVPAGKESTTDGINSIITGQNQTGDRAIPNVKVTLYECPLDASGNLQYSNGQLVRHVADLLSEAEKNSTILSEEEKLHRVNPQLTDSNGYYQFDGLDSSNKYYVGFEYNGQVYLPTDYLVNGKEADGTLTHYSSVQEMVNAKLYNTDIWRITSKGTEADNDRNPYDAKFAEIGSSPLNYVSSNSLNSGELVKQGSDYYNETFSQYELMGFVLDGEGNYQDDGIALIDGFYTLDEGKITELEAGETLEEHGVKGIINEKINEHINTYKEYPKDEAMKDIYTEVVEDAVRKVSNNKKEELRTELWRKLQFIEDCKMKAYTGSPLKGGAADFYPVYDDFTINNTEMVIPGEGTKPPIYDGQYYVNLGLWRRQETDLALRKDILYAATKINGKTEVYKYDKRAQTTQAQKDRLRQLRERYENNGRTKEDYDRYLAYKNEVENSTFWEIQLRMRDYNNYYASTYARETYPADYSYRRTDAHTGDELELYVTYRITVRNISQSILTEVNEIVDYYDKDYTYIDDLSWVMYGDNEEISIKEDDYHDTIDAYTNKRNFKGDLKNNAKDVDSSYSTRENSDGTYTGTSKYGSDSQTDMEEEYNSVYINGLEGRKLESGEEAYVYLTFRVNKDKNGIILDEDDSMKQNYAEINGYSTYYKDNTKLPNGVTIRNNKMYNSEGKQVTYYEDGSTKYRDDSAGFIDINSNPGNLTYSDTLGAKAEKNFENDTDRAKSIKVTVNDEFIRSINGTAWEDQRNQPVENSKIGDGVRKDEIGISGVTVQLVEKLANGKEYVWQTTTTDENGHYEFKTNDKKEVYIIPGNYIIRFQYGNTASTVVPSNDGNKVSYNGQDFKSTVYQKDMNNNEEVSGYNEEYYDISEADAFGSNLSDAKDIWDKKTVSISGVNSNNYKNETYLGREEVNQYSSSNITNHIAEVLASPYANPNNNTLINELINKTKMTAETGIIVLEGEYNRTDTDGDRNISNGADDYRYGNDKNGSYTLNNVDLGLTERPKAQLELNKKVTNVKLTLANGNTLFDATKGTTDLTWTKGSAYELNKKISNNKYDEYYNRDHRYAYRTEVDKLVSGKYNSSGDNGLIQVIMDEEIMHGATIRISYDLTVTNVGETDYEGKDFYYKGTNTSKTVTTKADVVLDYVANNLQFRANDNKGWSTVNNVISTTGINSRLTNSVAKFNTVIKTEGLNAPLVPKAEENSQQKASTTVGLVLTQLITPENTADDKTYNNIAEITTISNSVGRRMAYSVQGNQDPTTIPAEVDSAKSEKVVILPPFGIGEIVTYIAVAVGALVILTVGIIFIKKKVLNK